MESVSGVKCLLRRELILTDDGGQFDPVVFEHKRPDAVKLVSRYREFLRSGRSVRSALLSLGALDDTRGKERTLSGRLSKSSVTLSIVQRVYCSLYGKALACSRGVSASEVIGATAFFFGQETHGVLRLGRLESESLLQRVLVESKVVVVKVVRIRISRRRGFEAGFGNSGCGSGVDRFLPESGAFSSGDRFEFDLDVLDGSLSGRGSAKGRFVLCVQAGRL